MKKSLIIGIAVVIVAALAGVVVWTKFSGQEQVACTEEAKLCADGSAVGRTGPNCEFAPCPSEETRTRSIKLFYYDPEKDKDATGNVKCSRDGLAAIEREIPFTNTPVQDIVTLLLKGKENLTQGEIAQGISTEYPLEGFSLKGASLKNGVLTLEFNDLNNKTVGGACRVGILWFQIETTVKQLPEVREVRFLPEELFQP